MTEVMEMDNVDTFGGQLKNEVNLRYPKFNYPNVTAEQKVCIESILDGKDVLCVLPTGHGKTMIVIMAALFSYLIRNIPFNVVMISPLIALMENQLKMFNTNFENSAVYIKKGTKIEDITNLLHNDKFSVLLISPETLSEDIWQGLLFKSNLINLVAVDEAHCISEWGDDFRPMYKELGRMGNTKSSVIAMTATCNIQTKEDIFQVLGFDETTVIVQKSPDRPEIFLHLDESVSSIEQIKWLEDHLIENGVNSKKIILFADSPNQCAKLFTHFYTACPEYVHDGPRIPENRLVEMFHSGTLPTPKERILKSFENRETGKIRILICTVAFGMGVDIKDVDLVVHYGHPKSAMEYWQGVGRCSRGSGRTGVAIIYTKSFYKLKGLNVNSVNINKCLRKTILSTFMLDEKCTDLKAANIPCNSMCMEDCKCECCTCCSVCKYLCTCDMKTGFKCMLRRPRL